jgi:hypothetical protein
MSESAPERDTAADGTETQSEQTGSDQAQSDQAQSDQAQSDQPEFVNRAARRAKGKAGGKPQAFEKGQAPAGRGSVQSPRQYGTRRSG